MMYAVEMASVGTTNKHHVSWRSIQEWCILSNLRSSSVGTTGEMASGGIHFSYKHSAQNPTETPIIVDVFTVLLLRNG
jgi:hypothetical protein